MTPDAASTPKAASYHENTRTKFTVGQWYVLARLADDASAAR